MERIDIRLKYYYSMDTVIFAGFALKRSIYF